MRESSLFVLGMVSQQRLILSLLAMAHQPYGSDETTGTKPAATNLMYIHKL